MLQCVAVCCSVLQCVAVCCGVLQCVAVCCSVCIARECAYFEYYVRNVYSCMVVELYMCCGVLQCVAVCCSVCIARECAYFEYVYSCMFIESYVNIFHHIQQFICVYLPIFSELYLYTSHHTMHRSFIVYTCVCLSSSTGGFLNMLSYKCVCPNMFI